MSNNPDPTGELFNPFPGLRPFNQEETHLFFGREGQSKSVLGSLQEHNFVAVIGASGSGKSSLIYCGVIPELKKHGDKKWIPVSSRPGNSPVGNLVHELSTNLGIKVPDETLSELVNGDRLILDWIREVMPKGKSLLLVIDQFEEIFRFKRSGDEQKNLREINLFVEFIFNACSLKDRSIGVVLTMRSDFIGECSLFQDLTDLINRSNYLIPQMTREDFRKAIEGPVSVGGASIEEKLVEILLDEVGSDTDQLPVLQHALMRTWDYWMLQDDPSKPITVADYDAVGRMEKALSDHANEAYDELNEDQRGICENLFKAITEKGGDNRGVRRPTLISRIAEISKCNAEDIIQIAEVFRSGGRTFLTPYQPDTLNAETVIDISHESLMRIWDRLRLWVDEEAASVQMYMKLSEASEMYQDGTTGLWRPPDLQLALNWRDKQEPTATWAVQYDPAFERAMVYLDISDSEYRKEEENKIRLQKRRLRVTRMFSLVLGGIAVVAMGLFLYTRTLQNEAEARRVEAEEAKNLAIENAEEARIQKEAAEMARDSANLERQRAVDASEYAEEQRLAAVANADLARRRQILADNNAAQARLAEAEAQRNADTAEVQRLRAVVASQEARTRRMLSIAKSMSVKSLQIDMNDDPDLKALLALQAYHYNFEYGGPEHETDIYSGLYDARKALVGENYNIYSGHSQSVNTVAFPHTGDVFYSAGSDGRILSHSLSDTSRGFSVFKDLSFIVMDLALSPDGKYLAAGTKSDGIFVFDISRISAEPFLLMGHNGNIRDIEFSNDPNILYSIGIDKEILRWSLSERKNEKFISTNYRLNDIALSPDGNKLAACNRTGNITLYDTRDPGDPDTIKGTALNAVISLDYSPDGKFLAAGDKSGNVRIINAEYNTVLSSLRGSRAQIEAVEFSPGSNYIASSSYDGSVLMWEMADLNNPPIVMEDNKGFVFTVCFSSDERYIISGSENLVARPVMASQLTAGFCDMINRNLDRDEWESFVGTDIPYDATCPSLVTENFDE